MDNQELEKRVRDMEVSNARIISTLDNIDSTLNNLVKTRECNARDNREHFEKHIKDLEVNLVDRIRDHNDSTNSRLDRIEISIYGNGDEGLRSEVNAIKSTMNSWRKYLIASWTTFVTFIMGLVGLIIKYGLDNLSK